MPESLYRNKWHVFSISLCTLSAFLLLFIFRHTDDNRLTSWKWAFSHVELIQFIPLIIIGIFLIYVLLNSPITRQKPSTFLFFISFAISAIFWKVPEVIVDTSRYFTQAKHLEIYGIGHFISQWGKCINAWTDLPLVPLLYGLIFKLFGEARAFIQVFTSVIFSMTVVFTYLIGRTLWDEKTGFFAGALLWGIPYIFSQTPLMLVDVPAMFFVTLSIYTFIKALQKGGVWIVAASIAVFCTVFAKYSTWIMLSVLGVVFMVFLRQGQGARGKGQGVTPEAAPGFRNCIYRGMSVVLITGVLVSIVVYLKYEVIMDQMKFLREYQAPGLRRWGESFVSTFLFQIHPFITIAAAYSIYEAFKKKDLKFLIISWLVVLIVLLQIRRSRYVLVVFPMLTLMASYGLQRINKPEVRQYVVSCIVAVSLAVAMFAYLPFLQAISMVNLKKAGEFINSIDTEKVEVLTVQSIESAVNSAVAVPIIDLYTEKDIHYSYDSNSSLPLERIETSPLRFTWEYNNPVYYMHDNEEAGGNSAIVVVFNRDVKVLPGHIEEKIKGYNKVRTFDTATGLFRYSPVVAVYLPDKS
ncbi:MAG: glycosyltransferase family 39 protein [Nitrospirae bacterium]|nr:glycosyltransferase family 39 protein [Nitrospirota bacterium]